MVRNSSPDECPQRAFSARHSHHPSQATAGRTVSARVPARQCVDRPLSAALRWAKAERRIRRSPATGMSAPVPASGAALPLHDAVQAAPPAQQHLRRQGRRELC
ncbi:hypothetical protein SZ64_06360 [Erythrobacter sp. SG61-1L]|nr:hypothetical protein SZ64_06360 [Erythrobacter sp. SG61-1L]